MGAHAGIGEKLGGIHEPVAQGKCLLRCGKPCPEREEGGPVAEFQEGLPSDPLERGLAGIGKAIEVVKETIHLVPVAVAHDASQGIRAFAEFPGPRLVEFLGQRGHRTQIAVVPAGEVDAGAGSWRASVNRWIVVDAVALEAEPDVFAIGGHGLALIPVPHGEQLFPIRLDPLEIAHSLGDEKAELSLQGIRMAQVLELAVGRSHLGGTSILADTVEEIQDGSLAAGQRLLRHRAGDEEAVPVPEVLVNGSGNDVVPF